MPNLFESGSGADQKPTRSAGNNPATGGLGHSLEAFSQLEPARCRGVVGRWGRQRSHSWAKRELGGSEMRASNWTVEHRRRLTARGTGGSERDPLAGRWLNQASSCSPAGRSSDAIGRSPSAWARNSSLNVGQIRPAAQKYVCCNSQSNVRSRSKTNNNNKSNTRGASREARRRPDWLRMELSRKISPLAIDGAADADVRETMKKRSQVTSLFAPWTRSPQWLTGRLAGPLSGHHIAQRRRPGALPNASEESVELLRQCHDAKFTKSSRTLLLADSAGSLELPPDCQLQLAPLESAPEV